MITPNLFEYPILDGDNIGMTSVNGSFQNDVNIVQKLDRHFETLRSFIAETAGQRSLTRMSVSKAQRVVFGMSITSNLENPVLLAT